METKIEKINDTKRDEIFENRRNISDKIAKDIKKLKVIISVNKEWRGMVKWQSKDKKWSISMLCYGNSYAPVVERNLNYHLFAKHIVQHNNLVKIYDIENHNEKNKIYLRSIGGKRIYEERSKGFSDIEYSLHREPTLLFFNQYLVAGYSYGFGYDPSDYYFPDTHLNCSNIIIKPQKENIGLFTYNLGECFKFFGSPSNIADLIKKVKTFIETKTDIKKENIRTIENLFKKL